MRRLLLLVVIAAVLAGGCGGGSDGTPAPASTASPAARQAANGPARTAGAATTPAAPVHVAPSHAAVPILMYHVIAPAPAGAAYRGLWVAPETLRAELRTLAAAGFQAVTLDTVLDAWDGRARLPAHAIVVSFDDGYLSQGQAAADVLRGLHWPGVLNLAWHNLGQAGGLSATRVKRMIADGWEIDAHSLTHPDLTTLDATALAREVAGSRAAIRARFGVPADAFCYPAGRFDATVEAAVRAAGYRAATTEQPGAARPGGDRLALPRLRVDAADTASSVLARVRTALGSSA